VVKKAGFKRTLVTTAQADADPANSVCSYASGTKIVTLDAKDKYKNSVSAPTNVVLLVYYPDSSIRQFSFSVLAPFMKDLSSEIAS